MNPELLFWTACIPSRAALATLPVALPESSLKPLGYLLAGVSVTFFALRIFNLRKKAFEAGSNGTWWHQWRTVHGLMYALAAYLLIHENRDAWKVLAADIGVAILARELSKP